MFCAKCGTEVEAGSRFCQKCGTPVEQPAGQAAAPPQSPTAPPVNYQPVAVAKTSGMAIASLILGILGASLLAIIFGIIAISQINKSNGLVTGKGMAIAGIILGVISTIGYIIIIIALVVAAPTFTYFGI
jgi:uncharacterized membrane protein YvbJ